ncbi:MAG: lysostaphin resistance A-like protein, partial [Promethearchaeota archaeon]
MTPPKIFREQRNSELNMATFGEPKLPRWLTAILMFMISLMLLIISIFNNLVGTLYYFLTIMICLLLWLFVDMQQPESLGFRFSKRWWLGLVIGLALGGGVMGMIVVLELVVGWVSLTVAYTAEQGMLVVGMLAVYVIWQGLVAFAEELVGRGYIQQNLNTKLTAILAVMCSAIMFTALHLPSIIEQSIPLPLSTIMVLNITFGGLMLGWAFVKTQTLWLPIGIHFGWNFIQYHIAGLGYLSQGIYTAQNLGWEVITGSRDLKRFSSREIELIIGS